MNKIFLIVVIVIIIFILFKKSEFSASSSPFTYSFNGQTFKIMNVGLYDWAQGQPNKPNFYLKGGRDTEATGPNPTGMYGSRTLEDKDPGTTDWVIKPVEGTIYYTIQAKGNFKYSYLSKFRNPDNVVWINVSDTITDESQWIIAKRNPGKDKSGRFNYIIRNKTDNWWEGGNYCWLSTNGGYLLSEPGLWRDAWGSPIWWYLISSTQIPEIEPKIATNLNGLYTIQSIVPGIGGKEGNYLGLDKIIPANSLPYLQKYKGVQTQWLIVPDEERTGYYNIKINDPRPSNKFLGNDTIVPRNNWIYLHSNDNIQTQWTIREVSEGVYTIQ